MAEPSVAASLSKLEGALEEYLALGADTPLAGQAQSWLGQVREERNAMKSEDEAPPEEPSPESEDSSPSNFRDARKAAGEAMRNGTLRSDRGGAKTEDEEQPQDEEAKKKRTKAF